MGAAYDNNHISAADAVCACWHADCAGQAVQRDRGGGAPGKDAGADKAEPCGEGKTKQSDSKEGKECASLKAGSY